MDKIKNNLDIDLHAARLSRTDNIIYTEHNASGLNGVNNIIDMEYNASRADNISDIDKANNVEKRTKVYESNLF